MNKNEIANMAISNLGQTVKIVDFTTDNSFAASILRQWWRPALLSFLESHTWNFAKSYAPLPVGLSTPSSGYGYSYQKPADALVIRRLAPKGCFPKRSVQERYALRWEEVNVGTGVEIWSDVEDAHAEYTVALSDDYDFPYHFAIGFSYFLASMIGPKLITNNWPKVYQSVMPFYNLEIQKAMSQDIGHQPDMVESNCSMITIRGLSEV